jgi:Transmembrane domain of unknown function (DUF3566)
VLMTERPADQAPVQTHPDTSDDTARIPLAERLQRRIGAATQELRTSSQASQSSGRILPPPPPEQVAEKEAEEAERARRAAAEREAEQREAEERRAEQARLATTAAPVAPVAAPEAVPAGPAGPSTATTRRTAKAAARAPRRARLRLSRIDPWSVMKVSFLLSIAFGIVTVVAVFMIWSVLNSAGVWTSINNTVSDTVSSGTTRSTFNIEDYLGMSRVLGFTMLVAVIDVVLITAIATLGAFLYNMASSLLGGIEVTLTEDQG